MRFLKGSKKENVARKLQKTVKLPIERVSDEELRRLQNDPKLNSIIRCIIRC